MKMYKYINEPSDDVQKEVLWKKAEILTSYLSLEDDLKLREEFVAYRDKHYEEDQSFEPWYVWVMGRLDVSVTIRI